MPESKKPKNCSNCLFSMNMCLCSSTQNKVILPFRLIFVLNKSEFFKLSNTARLGLINLYPCEFRIRGLKNSPLSYENLKKELSESEKYLLFPGEASIDIEESLIFEKSEQKKVLIVPDGNWAGAAKIAHKIKNHMPCTAVSLKNPPTSNYQLRSNPNSERISTFEATLSSIKKVINKTDQQKLEKQFLLLKTNVLQLRGKISRTKKEQ